MLAASEEEEEETNLFHQVHCQDYRHNGARRSLDLVTITDRIALHAHLVHYSFTGRTR